MWQDLHSFKTRVNSVISIIQVEYLIFIRRLTCVSFMDNWGWWFPSSRCILHILQMSVDRVGVKAPVCFALTLLWRFFPRIGVLGFCFCDWTPHPRELPWRKAFNLGLLAVQRFSPSSSRWETQWHSGRRGAGDKAERSTSDSAGSTEWMSYQI